MAGSLILIFIENTGKSKDYIIFAAA